MILRRGFRCSEDVPGPRLCVLTMRWTTLFGALGAEKPQKAIPEVGTIPRRVSDWSTLLLPTVGCAVNGQGSMVNGFSEIPCAGEGMRQTDAILVTAIIVNICHVIF